MAMLKRQIKEILTPKVIGVSPDDPASRAVGVMRERHISCIVALEDGKPAGILTERSVARYAASRGLDFTGRKVREIMSAPVLTVTGETYIYEAFNILGHSKIRHLVVVDEENQAVGMVTQSNLIEHLGTDYFREIRRINQIMSKLVFTAPPDYPLQKALMEMADKSISCIVAAQDDKPLGMFTERDVVRMVDEGLDPANLTLADVMRSPVAAVNYEASVREASDLMRIRKIRRLAVTDEQGNLAGLSTQSNLIKGLEGKYIETLKDVIREKETELRAASEDLREKTVYLDNILRSSIDMGIVAAGMDMRVNYFNPAAEKILARRSDDMIGRPLSDVHAECGVGRERVDNAFSRISRDAPHAFTFETANGHGPRAIDARVSGIWDDSGGISGFVLMLKDVTERKKAEKIIRHLAYHDPLTDLPNRALFHDRLAVELSRAKRNGSLLALFMVDLDRFKIINDTMGHHAGDMLLVAISKRFRERLRESDTVARMGGDEFMFLFPDIHGREDAEALAAMLVEMVEAPFEIDGRTTTLSASLGLALYPDDGDDADALMRKADGEMYSFKKLFKDLAPAEGANERDAHES